MAASSSCVKPAASRSAFRCAPKDPGALRFMAFLILLPGLWGRCVGPVEVL
jgi:hypothetical protein